MERVKSVPSLSRPYLGRGKQPGAGWLVGGLGCQAVDLSVRQGQPGAAARSWAVRGEREVNRYIAELSANGHKWAIFMIQLAKGKNDMD